ncbi:YbhB/YbcL family Raf kinase inhibitor-like protein [Microbulbifer pacificus]|uniref:YbhB/YbcL family Raf kinase inhibitor-like protein n=1 Tax=Microbulbifer pacificus TaxID=407164 RepID=A0AAU0N1M3_9GAMM|nr:YbhB/YbcL family Raf kinase inhibitor-like protein [Microbulbifer pacificus]WOX06149.1 YbhB/YbcL family Raf kinase inhibitor-like protein [Microbulbifer pacificus]
MAVWLSSLGLLSLFVLPTAQAGAEVFTLASNAVSGGDRIASARLYMGSSCSGENISPELHWRDAPLGTRSFALTMYDPDADSGSGRWHWVVFNIPAESMSLPEGAGEPKSGLIPEAIQGRTDFRGHGYSGACPPEGSNGHRYQFRIYALKVDLLPLDESSPAAMVADHIHANKLAEAQMDVIYGR